MKRRICVALLELCDRTGHRACMADYPILREWYWPYYVTSRATLYLLRNAE